MYTLIEPPAHIRIISTTVRFGFKSYTGGLALFLCTAGLCAQQASLAEDPQVLAREVVRNELQAQQEDQARWKYVSREQQPGGDHIKEVIETKEGALSCIISEDQQPLTSQ
jgi:hypothetical protein